TWGRRWRWSWRRSRTYWRRRRRRGCWAQDDALEKDVRLLFGRTGGQIVAVIGPGDVEKSRSGIGYIVVAHVHRVDHSIAAKLRKGCRSAYRGARRKCDCPAGDGANASIVLKQVVTRVFLAAVIEDA